MTRIKIGTQFVDAQEPANSDDIRTYGELLNLRAENAKLRDALRPFAGLLNGAFTEADIGTLLGSAWVQHIRAARDVLKDTP